MGVGIYRVEALPRDWARSLDSTKGKPTLRDKHGCPKHGLRRQPSELKIMGSNPTGPAIL